jgi:hypothetical protein
MQNRDLNLGFKCFKLERENEIGKRKKEKREKKNWAESTWAQS